MARLKYTTRYQHAAVERLVDLDRLGASPARYQRWLQRLYGLYAPLEDGLAQLPWTEAGLDFDARRKTALLIQDLTALGGYDEVPRIARCQQLPMLTTLAQGFGCLYVLEGATLGGRIIARRLSVSAQQGGCFYHCYGPHGGTMWQHFGQAVTTYATTHPECTQSILDAACATFQCFEQWLGEWERE